MRATAERSVRADAGVGSRRLIASVVSDAQRLVALEVALARQELKELAIANAIAAGLIAFGGLFAMLAILVAAPVLVVVTVPWKWQATAVWLVGYLVLGAALIVFGRSRLQVHLPTRTLDTLKENKEWALRRVRSNGR